MTPGRRRITGLLMIGLAVVAGWLVLSSSSHQTAWVTTRPIAVGVPLADAGLVPAGVNVPSESDVLTDGAQPTGVAALDVPSGTLVASHLVSHEPVEPSAAVTLAVAAGRMPEGLRPGDALDVWSVSDGRVHQELVHARVISVGDPDQVGVASVSVAVEPGQESHAIAATAAESVALIRYAGS